MSSALGPLASPTVSNKGRNSKTTPQVPLSLDLGLSRMLNLASQLNLAHLDDTHSLVVLYWQWITAFFLSSQAQIIPRDPCIIDLFALLFLSRLIFPNPFKEKISFFFSLFFQDTL